MTNGVWQGGVLSLILFSVYINELLQHLQKIGVGCHWEGMFVGSLCYLVQRAFSVAASFLGFFGL